MGINPSDIIDTIVHTVLDWILSLRGWAAIGGVFLMAFVETGLFIGLVIPGETAMAIAGVVAARHDISLFTMIALGAAGAILGDNASYWLGRWGGRGIVFRYGILRRHVAPRFARAERFFGRHGMKAILFGRWIGWLRAVLPFAAGLGEMSYLRFVLWTVIAGVSWASVIVTLGYVLGDFFVDALRQYSTPIVLGFMALILGIWGWGRWRSDDDESGEGSDTVRSVR